MRNHLLKKLSVPLIALVLSGALGGCAMATTNVTGMLYAEVKGPIAATSNARSTKHGSAKATSILGLIATGDASIDAAAKAGNITQIHHVDYHTKNILGLYAEFTVTVYGE